MSDSNDLNDFCKLVKKESKSWSASAQKELLMNLAFTSASFSYKAKMYLNEPVNENLFNNCEKIKKLFYGETDSNEEED